MALKSWGAFLVSDFVTELASIGERRNMDRQVSPRGPTKEG